MPRHARRDAPGAVHHIIVRFVDRAFRIRDDEERRAYLYRLGAASRRSGWTVLAYAVMSNHVHLVALAAESSVASFTRPLHVGFAAWMNARHRLLGPLVAARPTVIVVDDGAVPRVLAYVHNNPVRAGVVTRADASGWSSHRAFVGLDAPPRWLAVRVGLRLAGFDGSAAGRAAFAAEVDARRGDRSDSIISAQDLAATRRSIRALVGSAAEIGSPFLEATGVQLAHEVRVPLGAAVRPRWPRPLGDALVRSVAAVMSVPADEIVGLRRGRAVSRARRVALLAGNHLLGRPLIEVAATLGISVQAASALLRRTPSASVDPLRASAAAVVDAIVAAADGDGFNISTFRSHRNSSTQNS